MRDTTVWFACGSEGTSSGTVQITASDLSASASAILLNISHMAYFINGEYC